MSLNQLILRFKEYAWHRHCGDEREVVAEFEELTGKPGALPTCVVLKVINHSHNGKERYTTLVALRPVDIKRIAAALEYETPQTWREAENSARVLNTDFPLVES